MFRIINYYIHTNQWSFILCTYKNVEKYKFASNYFDLYLFIVFNNKIRFFNHY